MWGFVRWQAFLWQYREQMHLAFMEDDSAARGFLDAKAAEWRLASLLGGVERSCVRHGDEAGPKVAVDPPASLAESLASSLPLASLPVRRGDQRRPQPRRHA